LSEICDDAELRLHREANAKREVERPRTLNVSKILSSSIRRRLGR
jgi:hypothetical protein